METQDFYEIIMTEKAAQTELSSLTTINSAQDLIAQVSTTSKVAEHNLWAWITGMAMKTLYKFFELFKKDVAEIMANKEPGTTLWYREMMFLFQFNYQLYWINRKFQYNDTTSAAAIASRVIKYCAVDGRTGRVVVKVAGESGGLPTQLSTTHANAAFEYLKKIRFCGSRVQLLALPADRLKVIATVYFDPLLDQADVQTAVEAEIIRFNRLIPFNGKYNINKLIDAVQALPGVIDFVVDNVYYKYGSVPYTPIVVEWQTNAGYVVIDPVDTLATTITYTPYLS